MSDIINRTSGDPNVSGLRKILFRSTSEFSSVVPGTVVSDPAKYIPTPPATPRGQQIDSSFFLANHGAGITEEAEFSLDTAFIEVKPDETPQGILYKSKIQWTVAKDYDSRVLQFDDMEGREFLVLACDNNDVWRLFGHQTMDGVIKGMRFAKEKNTGANRNGNLNYWLLSFVLECYIQPFPAKPL